jgi:ABC-type uncharacterized transport system substrate-binding protein
MKEEAKEEALHWLNAPKNLRWLDVGRGNGAFTEELVARCAPAAVSRRVAVLAALGTVPTALAAKASTTTMPIVFAIGADPVAAGLVTSLSRPGGNLTGATRLSVEVTPKRLEALRELLPKATTIALLVNPTDPPATTAAAQRKPWSCTAAQTRKNPSSWR